MNTTYCLSEIPEDLKKQVADLISKSGIPAKDFIKGLADYYNIKDVSANSTVLDYSNYWNSFVD
ncbi:hydrolase [Clostridium sp. WILCCON 0269]|uniref:Hydrolase n=1 Tax=Candidatus Clostridium eludens TaxID=3381663 RepID=A0ABW8SI71_9CLOT